MVGQNEGHSVRQICKERVPFLALGMSCESAYSFSLVAIINHYNSEMNFMHETVQKHR